MAMIIQITLQSLPGLPASTLLDSSPLRLKHLLSQFANPVRQHIMPVLTRHCMATRLPRGRPSYRLPTILPEVPPRCPLIAHTSPGPDLHLIYGPQIRLLRRTRHMNMKNANHPVPSIPHRRTLPMNKLVYLSVLQSLTPTLLRRLLASCLLLIRRVMVIYRANPVEAL
jgi:hypothetical protein